MKNKFIKIYLWLLCLGASTITIPQAFAQDRDISLLTGTYDQSIYTAYSPVRTIQGTYKVSFTKSSHTFIPGDFRIQIGFPPGAVFAGIPTVDNDTDDVTITENEFQIIGKRGSTSLEIHLKQEWSGTGPANVLRRITIPIFIVGQSNNQPTSTFLQWDSPSYDENPIANSTGSNLTILNALPVKLATFTASKAEKTAKINWTTTEELKSDRFAVERSFDGIEWDEIGSVKSHTESYTLKPYQFIDELPANGSNYYRLKMIDLDGTFALSHIRSLIFEGLEDITSVYPNPTSDLLNINTKDFNTLASVKIYNLNGINVYTAQSGKLSRRIDVKALTVGNYIVELVNTSGQTKTSKIVIVR